MFLQNLCKACCKIEFAVGLWVSCSEYYCILKCVIIPLQPWGTGAAGDSLWHWVAPYHHWGPLLARLAILHCDGSPLLLVSSLLVVAPHLQVQPVPSLALALPGPVIVAPLTCLESALPGASLCSQAAAPALVFGPFQLVLLPPLLVLSYVETMQKLVKENSKRRKCTYGPEGQHPMSLPLLCLPSPGYCSCVPTHCGPCFPSCHCSCAPVLLPCCIYPVSLLWALESLLRGGVIAFVVIWPCSICRLMYAQ